MKTLEELYKKYAANLEKQEELYQTHYLPYRQTLVPLESEIEKIAGDFVRQIEGKTFYLNGCQYTVLPGIYLDTGLRGNKEVRISCRSETREIVKYNLFLVYELLTEGNK